MKFRKGVFGRMIEWAARPCVGSGTAARQLGGRSPVPVVIRLGLFFFPIVDACVRARAHACCAYNSDVQGEEAERSQAFGMPAL